MKAKPLNRKQADGIVVGKGWADDSSQGKAEAAERQVSLLVRLGEAHLVRRKRLGRCSFRATIK